MTKFLDLINAHTEDPKQVFAMIDRAAAESLRRRIGEDVGGWSRGLSWGVLKWRHYMFVCVFNVFFCFWSPSIDIQPPRANSSPEHKLLLYVCFCLLSRFKDTATFPSLGAEVMVTVPWQPPSSSFAVNAWWGHPRCGRWDEWGKMGWRILGKY